MVIQKKRKEEEVGEQCQDRKFGLELFRVLCKICLDLSLVPEHYIEWARTPVQGAVGLAKAELPDASHKPDDTVDLSIDETDDLLIDETGDTGGISSPIASSHHNLGEEQGQAAVDGVKFDKVVEIVQVMFTSCLLPYTICCRCTVQITLLQQAHLSSSLSDGYVWQACGASANLDGQRTWTLACMLHVDLRTSRGTYSSAEKETVEAVCSFTQKTCCIHV